MWKSDSAPTGTISMGDKSWNGLQDVSSFEQYYNKTQKVTITCDNNSDPSITVGYLISDSALSSDDLGAATFTKYKKAFSIKDEGKYVIYAKLSSEDGKTTYLSTDGFIIDTHAPKVTGIADGETYCLSAVMTVKESHLAKVTVNGEEKSLDDDHSLALEATDGEQTIIVSDKAGNETKLTVTVNKKHTAETDDGDCTTPQKCRYCGEIVVEGKSSHDLGNWTSDGNGKTHSRKCKNKGCGYKVIEDCSGGTATCKKKAVCSVCGKSYGELSTTNHTDLKKTDYVAATTSSKGNIEYWYCSACKKYFSNKGCTKEISKADTVIDKAAPEIIGGKGSKWSKASKNTIKFRSNAEYADFVCVLIDDKELDPSYYNKKEGSIIIELKTSYLESLSVGSHTITIRSKTTTPTVKDYAVTVHGKTDILFYVTKVDNKPEYTAVAKAFTDFGYKCGQVVNNDNSKYYEITTGADAGKVYKATDNGALSVLVDGKLVKLDNTSAAAVKEHNWSVSASKVENGKVIPTEAVCGICGSKSTAIYETGKAPAGSKVETLNGVTGYVVVPNGASTTTPSGNTTSPKTFDAGIAMYVGMALTSVAGSAVVIGKKKEF